MTHDVSRHPELVSGSLELCLTQEVLKQVQDDERTNSERRRVHDEGTRKAVLKRAFEIFEIR